jgi:hypothetical protein
MVYFAEASANGSVKAYFKTRRSIVVTSLATATATSTVSYEDAYKIALGIAQDVANSNAQNDANIMQVSVDTATIGETDFYLDSSLLKDFVTRDGNNYTLTGDFTAPDGWTLSIAPGEQLIVPTGLTYSVGKDGQLKVDGALTISGTIDGTTGTLVNNSSKTVTALEGSNVTSNITNANGSTYTNSGAVNNTSIQNSGTFNNTQGGSITTINLSNTATGTFYNGVGTSDTASLVLSSGGTSTNSSKGIFYNYSTFTIDGSYTSNGTDVYHETGAITINESGSMNMNSSIDLYGPTITNYGRIVFSDTIICFTDTTINNNNNGTINITGNNLFLYTAGINILTPNAKDVTITNATIITSPGNYYLIVVTTSTSTLYYLPTNNPYEPSEDP